MIRDSLILATVTLGLLFVLYLWTDDQEGRLKRAESELAILSAYHDNQTELMRRLHDLKATIPGERRKTHESKGQGGTAEGE